MGETRVLSSHYLFVPVRLVNMDAKTPFKQNEIYAHRGCWDSSITQNSLVSFQVAELNEFSIETDIRQSDSELVINHDHQNDSVQLLFSQLFEFKTSFALNIKEDGLQDQICAIRPWIESTGSFVFDGSIPQMYQFNKLGIPHALRLSEFEKSLPWKSAVIWLDAFTSDWWIKDRSIPNQLRDSKVVVVSPELHGRDPRAVWDFLAKQRFAGNFNFAICTDRPTEYLSWS